MTRSLQSGMPPVAREATAADLLNAPVVTVRDDDTVREASRRMLENRIGAVPVLSSSGAPIGMVSDGDLLGRRARDSRREWWLDLVANNAAGIGVPAVVGDRVIREVMSAPLVTISPNTSATAIFELMRLHRLKRLPVVTGGTLVGIVSQADLVGFFAALKSPQKNVGHGLLEFLEGLIGGASLRGLPRRHEALPSELLAPPTRAFTAASLRDEAQAFEAGREARLKEERTENHLKHQRELKEMLNAHVQKALLRNLMVGAEAAAKRGEMEMQLLQFPCELCTDGGRMIDVQEEGWETTLRGEAAELYARWRDELGPQGFRLDARIVGWDEQGVLAEAGLFLQWGARRELSR